MKRLISCTDCFVFFDAGPPPGEWIIRKQGIALNNFSCDYCGKVINRGDVCTAESLGMTGQGVPYYRWEYKYILERN
jgi:hypothetical protein